MGNCCSSLETLEEREGKPKAHVEAVDPPQEEEREGEGKFVLNMREKEKGKEELIKEKRREEREVLEKKYILGREVGRGEFGVTYECRDGESGEMLACKSISKRKLRTAEDMEDVWREVGIMKHLPHHPNIVGLVAVYEDDKCLHLVMELCKGGELFDRIVARGHYTERAAASVMRTIVEVVQVCHKHGVIHRDLKPENFLYADKKENSLLKAIDFGLSVQFKPGQRFSEIVGSPYYMAPEVLKRDYGPEIDVWSAGVILYILLCGVPPFWAESEEEVARAILTGKIDFQRDPWPMISENAKSLVHQMLEPDPKLRLSAQQVLDHTWLQNARRAPNAPLGDAVRVRLKQFAAMNKLKKRALRVIAELLSGEEVEGIREMFKMMDKENTGSINFEKLKEGLQKIGSQLAEPEIKQLMEVADVNGKGTLNYGEFVAVTVHLQRMDNEEHLQKAFKHFDLNENGYIEFDELENIFGDEIGDNGAIDLINNIIQDVDTDKDGRISYEEFACMMRRGTDWRKASRQYSRELFNNLSLRLMRDGSLQQQDS